MRTYKLHFLWVCISFCNLSFGQDTHRASLDAFSGKFISAIRSHERQTVYLVTDKSIYTKGESIWFKAFLLNSISLKINNKSSFLFVDLVNEKDSVIKVLVLDAYNKQLDSRIVLPNSLDKGYYWLRAYTRQMIADDPNNICLQPLYIVSDKDDNNSIKAPKKNNSSDTDPSITFYPEGGSIITGINSTVGLRAADANGAPLNIQGFIKDNYDAVSAAFSTDANGLGKFSFEPAGRRKYRAVINWNGKEISYPLPPFNFYSGQLSVTKLPDVYKLRILLGDSVYRKDFLTYLIGVSKDSLFFASIGQGQYELSVDKQKLPDGIATFYLFDENFKLLSERSVYVNDNNVHVTTGTGKSVYGKRDKVSLNLSVTGNNQNAVPSLVAISVTDTLFTDPGECQLPGIGQYQQSINNILLAHDECFDESEKDLIMLARNSSYEFLSKKSDPPVISDNDSLFYIRGTVLNEKNEPLADKIVTLLFQSGDMSVHTDTTDNSGHFNFPFANYADSTQFALEVSDLNGRSEKSRVVLALPKYPKVNTPVALKDYIPVQPKAVKRYTNIYNDVRLGEDKKALPGVIVKGEAIPANYNQLRRVSPNSTIITSDQLNENTKVGNAILMTSGVHLVNGVLVINGLTSMKAPDRSSEPLLLVDGAEVNASADIDGTSPVLGYLNSLNPKDIDFIEILKGAEGANYGVRGGKGVILVNFANKRKDINNAKGNMKIFYAQGVSKPALFPNITYGQDDKNPPVTVDNRSTLFWNGGFLTGSAGNVALTFYTSDIPATYKITVTGITVHGDFIYKTLTFRSK